MVSSSSSSSQAAKPSDGLLKVQQGDYVRHTDGDVEGANNSASDNNEAAAAGEQDTWRVTDFGQVGDFSRDGSPHATDEVINSASHLAALLLSILGTVILVVESSAQGEPWKIVSFSLYGASLIFLFSMSTLHHGIVGKLEGLFRMLDYLAIYPLIAGTFTPLCLVFYHNSPIGWAFCMTVWAIAIIAMLATACCFTKIPKWLSMTMYITLGWFGACFTYWLIPVLGYDGFAYFFAGGVCFTVGGYIFSTESPNPIPGRFGFHEIWHICVILGALLHWLLMFLYVLPWEPEHNGENR